jgi:hypothetical protein
VTWHRRINLVTFVGDLGLGCRGTSLTGGLYICWLTDEYKSFFTTAYFGCLPGQGTSKTGKLYNISHSSSNMTHNSNITHISSNPQYSLRQAKQVWQLYRSWQVKRKPKLGKQNQRTTTTPCRCRRILSSGSRGRQQSHISLPTALWSWAAFWDGLHKQPTNF